ncbi:MAG: histidine ammonia-lyase [Planctomycetes bacterium]|nr:histidine ammonia-lyase [Planctomycetota bacterium]
MPAKQSDVPKNSGEIVRIDGEHLTVEQVHKVAREYAKVEVTPEAKKKVDASAQLVLDLVNKGEALYGITTGIGEFARIRISKEQSEELQKRIVYSHAAGYGEWMPEAEVRAAMLLRANVISKGYSATRYSTLMTLIGMINHNVIPLINKKGSVGTSGDLSPMSQMAEVVMGEGEAIYNGKRMKGGDALKAAGLKPVQLTYKEGLGLINGSQMMTGWSALIIYDAERVLKNAQIASAMTIDVLQSVLKAFDSRLHRVRPFLGQNSVAANIRTLVAESEILAQRSAKVQDGYSLRCTPQVIGPAMDALEYVRDQIEIEMNAGADNPLFFVDDKISLTGGNFHGQPVAAAMDFLGMVLTFVGGLSERHTNRMLNPVLSGLPDFLVEGKGLNSGLMVAQYTAAALVSECKVFAHPACVDSISVSADQEDYVSMGPIAAHKAREMLTNLIGVIAIEMMAAAQAMDFRKGLKPGKGTRIAYEEIRKLVKFLEDDKVLYHDIESVAKLIRENTILNRIEKEVGELKLATSDALDSK